ncbi:DNA-damage-repair toleration chloroplastic-like [Micractinium conductrix]|uniref:DNA-damage-repair toleration chloroplastic-like n=1 Tax=Micractinium conductrix TaxID=554055 RepID=A0A2P6V4B5_9CHLO|nr:DNA-damage-repair toleration chloroplastic-like [Micractinium conductrix]|eukprot:PSC68931.1 DNA-damage-repair toleration chloroplastic-like [Micractinium conductrix]
MASFGLYGGLPSTKDGKEGNADETPTKKEGWVGSGITAFAPAALAAKRAAALAASLAARGFGPAGRGRGREGPSPLSTGRGDGGGRGRGAAAAAKEAAQDGGSVLLAAASAHEGPITVTATAVPAMVPGMSLGQDIREEYDPAKPNDYDAVLRQREIQRREAEAEAERQERLREERQAAEARRREEEERRRQNEETLREMRELEALEMAREAQLGGGAAQPPAFAAATGQQQQQHGEQQDAAGEEARRAALALSGEEAWKRRGMPQVPAWQQQAAAAGGGGGGGSSSFGFISAAGAGLGSGGGGVGLGVDGGAAAPQPPAGNQPKGMSLAQKLMEKMGWKAGEGLGRNRQGMAAPLIMQKTDVRTGVIVSGAPPPGMEQPPSKRPRSASFNRPPTRVVLLTNMIGPGDVDQDLDREVGEECSKYGNVTNVMIFEATEPGFPEDQAVRIFVQFERVEEATKALVDLQGRFFAGREVEASFFEEARFENKDLAPRPEEEPGQPGIAFFQATITSSSSSSSSNVSSGGGGGGGGSDRCRALSSSAALAEEEAAWRRQPRYSTFSCVKRTRNWRDSTCKFSSICLNTSSMQFHYYVDPALRGVPLLHDKEGKPLFEFPEELVNAGHSHWEAPWRPAVVHGALPREGGRVKWAPSPQALLMLLRADQPFAAQARNFGHVLYDFTQALFNMQHLFGVYTPQAQPLLLPVGAHDQRKWHGELRKLFSNLRAEKSMAALHWNSPVEFAADYGEALLGGGGGGGGGGLVCFKSVLVGTGPLNRRVSQVDARPYRDAAACRLGLKEEPQQRPVITIMHKEGRRTVENSADIQAALQARYGGHVSVSMFACCDEHRLAVPQQVKLMSDTSILITPGGGLASVLNFLRPSATAITMTAYHSFANSTVPVDGLFYENMASPLIEMFPVTLAEYEGTSDRPRCELSRRRGRKDAGRVATGGALVNCNLRLGPQAIDRLAGRVDAALVRWAEQARRHDVLELLAAA